MDDLMGKKRLQIAKALQKIIQKAYNQKRLGVELTFVGLCNVHPPAPVASEFEAEISAMEEKETKILEAQKYRNEILPMALAEKQQILIEAQSYLESQKQLTSAEADAFGNWMLAYNLAGKLYLQRKYLKLLEEYLPGKRIYVVGISGTKKEVDILNLEDKFSGDLLNIDLNKVEQEKEKEK
jgi:membrane protease subunit HflK